MLKQTSLENIEFVIKFRRKFNNTLIDYGIADILEYYLSQGLIEFANRIAKECTPLTHYTLKSLLLLLIPSNNYARSAAKDVGINWVLSKAEELGLLEDLLSDDIYKRYLKQIKPDQDRLYYLLFLLEKTHGSSSIFDANIIYLIKPHFYTLFIPSANNEP